MPPEFETRAQRRARRREELKSGQPRSPKTKWLWWVLPLVVIGGGVFWLASRPPLTAAEKLAKANKARTDLVMSCTTDMATTFHIHSHISIIINGAEQTIPANAGITANCLHPIHTHDDTGIIHMESPVREDFTIGDFFLVWGKAYTATKLMDTTIDAQHQLKLFIDGQEVATGPDTVMTDHQSIAIMVGPTGTPLIPPANFVFPSNLPAAD